MVTYNIIYDDECTTISEYIIEKTQVIEHNDLCDTQKTFHVCFILDINNKINDYILLTYEKNKEISLYFFKLLTYLLKPPIA